MIYSSTIKAKNGSEVPLFCDGNPMHSKYNPENEGANFAKDIKSGCVVVCGVGGGFHIASLLERLDKSSRLIAVEADFESLEFCMNLPVVKKICSDPRLKICSSEEICQVLKSNYLPAIHGDFSFFAHRSWEAHNQELFKKIKEDVESCLKEISADFSVQSHFGKIWQRNILTNLRAFEGNPPLHFDLDKTAAIIAAGPSLDKSINELKENRAQYCIFATDTSYGTLVANQVHADFVVSIDAQQVSASHFMDLDEDFETTFVFDIASSPTAVNAVRNKGFQIYFLRSAHPLCSDPELENCMPQVESGSGTVTIAAADFAKQAGFKKIKFYGADFAYSSGKAYASGTYLEKNFNTSSDRFHTAETKYDALMFRSPLKKSEINTPYSGKLENPLTSEILESYRKSLGEWILKNGFKPTDSLFERKCNEKNLFFLQFRGFNYKKYAENLIEQLSEIATIREDSEARDVVCKKRGTIKMLPYVAFLRKKHDFGDKVSFFQLLKLAYLRASRYTRGYEN